MALTAHRSSERIGSAPYRPIRLLRDPFPVWKLLRRAGLSKAASDTLTRGLKAVRTPGEKRVRKALLQAVGAGPDSATLAHMRRHGWAQIPAEMVPDAAAVADDLAAVARERRASNRPHPGPDSKKAGFLISLVKHEQFLDYPGFLKFITGPELVYFAARYLGEAPVLSGARLWWTPPNETAILSQQYHRDEEDHSQVKFLLVIEAVTTENGPFTLIPAEATQRVMAHADQGYGRFSDEEVAAGLDGEAPLVLTGHPGALFAVDTARCLHFGSRRATRDRLMLMAQYTRFDAPRSTVPDWGDGLRPLAAELDPLQRRALQLS
ncbi:MAG: hypothetical protein JRH10_14575 [Deltaproteobacteria bacterium]|nr:hypothetical protein [Deltaproteobacteria bacterium]MBW2447809.1 hypothetical protein [Deltaproteobacteria bacterium]